MLEFVRVIPLERSLPRFERRGRKEIREREIGIENLGKRRRNTGAMLVKESSSFFSFRALSITPSLFHFQ